MVAQQVDDRLDGLPHAHDAGRQRVERQIAAETAQEGSLSIQRQGILVFRADHPGQCRFAEQALGDNARRRRGDMDALVTARTGIFHALMRNHPDLLGNDVELLANFDTDLDQCRAVMGADTFGLGQLMAHDLAW